MSDTQKARTWGKSLLLVAGGAFGAWLLKKRRQENPSLTQTRHGDLTRQERADFARRHASTEQALEVMEAYGADPAIDFGTFMDAVRRIEQDALEDMRQLRRIIRRDEKRSEGDH
jgi:hypothetical protein